MTPFRPALARHAEVTKVDATAVESHINKLLDWQHWPVNIEDITADHINRWSNEMLYPPHREDRKLSPSTVQTRLSVLKKAMQRAGVAWPVDVIKPQRSKRPKWVLPEARQKDLVTWLRGQAVEAMESDLGGPSATNWFDMVDYIEFVTETGLRVEEVLRICGRHLHFVGTGDFNGIMVDLTTLSKPVLEVMGTKTVGSYDLIPLSKAALEILVRRREEHGDGRLFNLSYDFLRVYWQWCLEFLKVTDETATLKSLRRTFATRLAAKGIPATLLQKLMRHASLVTTSHYTNSVGLHEAAREWLN